MGEDNRSPLKLESERHEALQSIVETISGAMGLPASLWVVDEKEQHLRIAAAVGVRPSYVEKAILPLDEPSVAGDCFLSGQPQTVVSIARDKRWKYKEEAEEVGWKSYLSVPVRIAEETIGVLGVYTFVERSFTPFEQQLLTDYASQAGRAVESERRTVESERMRQAFQKLLDIARKLDRLAIADPQAVLRQVVQDAREITGADCVALYPYDLDREDFYEIEKVTASGLHKPLKLSDKPRQTGGMAAYVKREKEVVVEDIQEEDPDMLESPFIAREEIQAFMGVALEVAEGTVGILYIDYRSPHKFSDEEKNVIRLFARQVAIAVHNAWLFEQASRRAEVFEELHHIAHTITLIQDRDELLRQTLEQSLEILDAEFGSISVFDPAEELLQFKYARGKPEDRSVALGEGLIGKAAATRQTVRVADVSQDTRYVKHVDRTQSELDVPMMVGDRLVGVLNAESSRLDAFSEEDEQLAEALAAQAAVAFYKADLIEQHQVLVNFGREITSGIRLDEEEILNLIHEQAGELMDTDNMYIALYEPDPGQLDEHDPENPEQSKIYGTVRFPLAFEDGEPLDVETRKARKGRTEHIIRTREPLFHPTAEEGKQWYAEPGHEEYIGHVFSSWLGVPMMVGDKVLGVIATYHPTRDFVYSEDDLEILQAMANQAAVALDNAELYYDVNQRLESLAEIGRLVSSSIGMEESGILELIHSQASKLIDTDNMYIALYEPDPNQSDEYDPENPEQSQIYGTVRFPLAFEDGDPLDVETRKAGRGRTEYIIRTRKPLFHPTLEEGQKWYDEPGHEEYVGGALPSWLGVPMMVGERVLGVIATYHPTRDYVYSGDDLEILQAMANQAAIALDNAELYRQNRCRIEQLETVQDITNAIETHVELPAFLHSILELSLPRLEAEAGTIQLLDEDTNELVVWADVGLVVEREYARIPPGRGITGQAALEKNPVYVPDTSQSASYLPYLGETRSEFAVPLMVGDKVIGVFNIEDPKQDAFDRDIRDLCELIASQVAIAIQQKLQVEEEQEKRIEAEKDALLSKLTRDIAHHFKNKAGLVRLAALNLLEDPAIAESPRRRKDVEKILRNTESAGKLAQDLFEPYKETEPELVHVDWLFEEALNLVGEQEDVDIINNIAQDLPQVYVERQGMVNVFQELLLNGLKAVRRRERREGARWIEVESRLSEDKYVELLFSNTGPPIPKEDWETIFEQFAKLEKEPDEGGFGLGLWSARVFLRRQGGDIHVTKSNEVQTTFSVRLPMPMDAKEI